jgi:hypothetical protein
MPFPLPGLCLVIALSSVAPAQETAFRPVLQAMKEELSRSLNILGAQPVPPYFLSYEITDIYNVNISASFGALTHSNQSRQRQLDIDLRSGDYALDNTHTIRGSFPNWSDRYSKIDIPIEDDADAIRSILWYHTDKKYKKALEQLTKVQTNIQVKVEEEDQSDDFSKESAEQYRGESVAVRIDRAEWEEKVKAYSAPFARYGDIYQANATLFVTGETRRYVNSEGSEIQTSQAVYRLFISAFSKADDGMELPRYESFAAFTPEGLPDDQTLLDAVDRMIEDLHALRAAPIVGRSWTTMSGP